MRQSSSSPEQWLNDIRDYRGRVHLAIVSVKPEEEDEILLRFPRQHSVRGERDYGLCHVENVQGDPLLVATVRQPRQGNLEANSVTRDVISDLDPEWILLVGIAGASPFGDAVLGDVVLGTHTHDLTVQVRNADGGTTFAAGGGAATTDVEATVVHLRSILAQVNLPRPEITLNPATLIYTTEDEEVNKKIAASLNVRFSRGYAPKILDGPIISTDALVKDVHLVRQWRETMRNTLAIEMESAGAYRAARTRVKTYSLLAIRGISDIVGLEKQEGAVQHACRIAAECALRFVQHWSPTRASVPREQTLPTAKPGSESCPTDPEPPMPPTPNDARLVAELNACLDAVITEAESLPPYYPRGAYLRSLRVRVRVTRERGGIAQELARQREVDRRGGLVTAHRENRIYHDRQSAVEDVSNTEGGALDWDSQVRGKLTRAAILGDPGFGKTWLLKWESAECATRAREWLRAGKPIDQLTLPVFIWLSVLSDALSIIADQHRTNPEVLPNFRAAVAEALALRDTPPRVREQILASLETPRVLLLLDAYDEVTDTEKRNALRAALRRWILSSSAHVLFTSRVVGYEPLWEVANSDAERELELLPIARPEVDSFVAAFFSADAKPGAAQGLLRILGQQPQLATMAQIPLVLGFLCAIYRDEMQKPDFDQLHFARLRRVDI